MPREAERRLLTYRGAWRLWLTYALILAISPACLLNRGQAAPPQQDRKQAPQAAQKPEPAALPEAPQALPSAQAPAVAGLRAKPPVPVPVRKIRVGTWNLLQLGRRKTKRVADIAALIDRELDVVAVQEVMTEQGIQDLAAHLPGWRVALSERAVGRKTHKEYYAVLYRTQLVTIGRTYLVDDAGDRFEREPYVACLQAQAFDFCLLTIHVVYGNAVGPRDAEITALGELAAALREREGERDWIVLGDFNREPDRKSWASLRQAGWHNPASQTFGTTLGKDKYSKPYDHMLIDPNETRELMEPPRRMESVALLCDGDFERCRNEVSDHAPVMAVFRMSGTDDD